MLQMINLTRGEVENRESRKLIAHSEDKVLR